MRLDAGIATSTSDETGTSRAAAMPPNVATVGDLAPRSMSEIMDAEILLREANSRRLRFNSSRRALTASPRRLAILFAIVDIVYSIAHYRCRSQGAMQVPGRRS